MKFYNYFTIFASLVLINSISPQGPITSFTQDVANDFIKLASYSYCDESSMKTGKCCPDLDKSYVLISTETLSKDNYTYAIFRNDLKKQVIVTFTGTKGKDTLLNQILESNMTNFKEPQKKMTTTIYFNGIYLLAKIKIKKVLSELKDSYPTYQFIFTGHSLGAAMSTIFALDSVLDGYVVQTAYSPALINYASPRVGNFYFAQNVMLKVPVIFRIVRSGDPITHVPPTEDKNALNLNKFDQTGNNISRKNLPEDNTPWHIAGLIMYDKDMTTYMNCGRFFSEHHPEKQCKDKLGWSSIFDTKKHTTYFGKKFGALCKKPLKKLKKFKHKF